MDREVPNMQGVFSGSRLEIIERLREALALILMSHSDGVPNQSRSARDLALYLIVVLGVPASLPFRV